MPSVDPVVLKLEADLNDYKSKIGDAQRLTDQKLDAIEKRGHAMGQGLKKGFDLAKGAAVAYAATLGVSTITNAITKGLEYASSLGEVAQQLGVTTNALQEYRYAGSQAGLSTEETDQALSQLTRRLGEAANGTKAQAEAFEKLGIEVKDANGEVLDAGEAIPLIAEALKGVHSPAERAAVLMDLFGRAGQKLEPLLSEGAAGVTRLREAAHEMNLVLSEEQIQNADKTADKVSELSQAFNVRIAGVVADNAGAIGTLANALAEVANVAGRAATEYRRFVALSGQLRSGAAYLNPFASSEERAEAGRQFEVFGKIKNSPDATYRPPVRVNPNAVRPGGNTIGGPGLTSPKPSGRRIGNVFVPDLLQTTRFADTGDSNPFGNAGQNESAALALLAVAPAAATQAVTKISVELQSLAAELAAAHADLTGSLEDRAEAERQRIDADLAAERERLLADKELGDLERQQRLLALDKIAAEKRAVVAKELAAGLAEQQIDLERQATRAADDAKREAEANKGPLGRYADSLGDPGKDVEEAVVRKLEDVNRGITDAIGKALGTDDPFIKSLLSILIDQILIRPITEMLAQAAAGAGGGGLLGGIVSGIGGLFGGGNGGFAGHSLGGGWAGRASGGYVAPGQVYRVNEGASPGRVEAFMSRDGGKIIPLGQMHALRNGGGGATVNLVVEEAPGFASRVHVIAKGAAVEVTKKAAPQIIEQSRRLAAKDAPAVVRNARRFGRG